MVPSNQTDVDAARTGMSKAICLALWARRRLDKGWAVVMDKRIKRLGIFMVRMESPCLAHICRLDRDR
jgi:hypothetical protein